MSISKLESLPNELLIDIFEKYINGVDILIAFVYLQNKRFDGIISQCQRFYFNFFNCRKDYFHFCIGLLPAYIEKIEELVLSEQNTPGQIHTFFSLFPSIIAFKRLRKIFFHFNIKSIDYSSDRRAILSSSNTTFDTILIQVINTVRPSTLNYVISDVLDLKIMDQLFLTSDVQFNQFFQSNYSLKIEYLMNSGISCRFENLKDIFRCDSHLKYLNVQLTSESYYNYHHLTNLTNDNIISMPILHTLLLSFQRDALTTFAMLAQCLKVIPALRRLEIKAHSVLLDAIAWEDLLQTSLPLLTHFSLKTTTSRINKDSIETTLASFETPFWIEKKNFYMIITKHKHLNSNRFYLPNLNINDQDEFNQPVIQWWIVPMRARIDDIPTKDIISFGISGIVDCLSSYYYFKNVKHLVIYNLDNNLLEWFRTYVNYSRIEYLDVSFLYNESITTSSLLSLVKSITSLRIQYNCLLAHQHIYSGNDNCLKYLDISVDNHSFHKTDIIIISQLFPNIEHLAISTTDLSNIPLLKNYLPHLCSLTFKIMDHQFSSYNNRNQKEWDYQLREQVKFLFQRTDEWTTVWIDQAALDEPYWQKLN